MDLGQVTAVRHVQLVWECTYAADYQLQTCADGTAWTTGYSTGAGDGGVDDVDLTASGRFVRLAGTRRGTGYVCSLWEFGVHR